jgi:hypothetical protein
MKIMKSLTLAAAAAGLGLASMGASAADAPAMAVAKCSDIVYNKEFLDKYPKAPAVCRSVSVKNGVKSAKFKAKVVGLEKGSIKVQFLNVADTPVAGMEPLTFTPKEGAKLSVNGKLEKYRDLKAGDSLSFYVSENRVGVVTDPEEAGDK